MRLKFADFLKEHYINEDTPEGDFARDFFRDKSVPAEEGNDFITYYGILLDHLEFCKACDEAIEAFKNIYQKYSLPIACEELAKTYGEEKAKAICEAVEREMNDAKARRSKSCQ